MSDPGRIWRERWKVWVPALAFFVLNFGAWAYYQAGDFGDRVNLLEGRLEDRQDRAKTLGTEEARLARLEELAWDNRRRIDELYSVRLSSQRFRLTEVIREVRDLARAAGLEPTSTSYPETTFEEFGIERKGFVFSVIGTYADLRTFVNALELTESFVTVDSIGLSPGGKGAGGRLRINFEISTLFASDEGLEEWSSVDLRTDPELDRESEREL